MGQLIRMFEVIQRARDLVSACNISEAPVDLAIIAKHEGIRQIRLDNLKLGGELRKLQSGGYLVRLNARDSEQRRRFTLAHEIAHTFVTPDAASHGCVDQNSEDLCNLAAAELLIPESLLRRIQWKMNIDSLCSLAETFRCSLEAIAWKVLNMPTWRGALLLWKITKHGVDLSAHLTAIPRTLDLQLPFYRSMVIRPTDHNWASVAAQSSHTVMLRDPGNKSHFWAERSQLGRATVALFIKLPQSHTIKGTERPSQIQQGSLFTDQKR